MEIFIYFILATVISIVLGIWLPIIKGKFGESKVSFVLSWLPDTEYKIFNDVLIPSKSGSSQIDHIVVSKYGVFVIETKNYKGWITGYENSEYWTKNMYGHKYQFYNPIKQNNGHITALMHLLSLPRKYFISIVAFSSNSDIKVNVFKHNVVYISQINSVIKKYDVPILENAEVDNIIENINSKNLISSEYRKNHVREIKHNVVVMKSCIRSGVCPKCGGTLVERKGQYGRFLGCSNYPKCKFTKKL